MSCCLFLLSSFQPTLCTMLMASSSWRASMLGAILLKNCMSALMFSSLFSVKPLSFIHLHILYLSCSNSLFQLLIFFPQMFVVFFQLVDFFLAVLNIFSSFPCLPPSLVSLRLFCSSTSLPQSPSILHLPHLFCSSLILPSFISTSPPIYFLPSFVNLLFFQLHTLAKFSLLLPISNHTSIEIFSFLFLCRGADLGSASLLQPYETSRQRKVLPLIAGLQALHHLYGSTFSPIVALRSFGLQTVDALPILKSAFSRFAMTH